MTRYPLPGDYIVVRSNRPAARAIQAAQFLAGLIRLRPTSGWRYNHAALYVGGGMIVEANPAGVQERPLSEYPLSSWRPSNTRLTAWQAQKAIAYARSKTAQGDRPATGYGWLDLFALALTALGIGIPFIVDRARRDDRLVCSQLVANAYERAGIDLADGEPWSATPADLADAIT